MKVSSLYIVQVKRKCGIELGENYNLARSEDASQQQCPRVKEGRCNFGGFSDDIVVYNHLPWKLLTIRSETRINTDFFDAKNAF